MNMLMKSRSVKRVAQGGLLAVAALGLATGTTAILPGTVGATTYPVPGPDPIAATVDGNPGESQYLAVTYPGTVYHNIYQESANGSGKWLQGWVPPFQPPGYTGSVAATADGNPDETQFIADAGNNVLYHNIRFNDGNWQGWVQIPAQPPATNGAVVSVAAAADGNPDETHFFALTTHGALYFNTRYANGNWQVQGWTPVPLPGGHRVASIAATADGNPGETQLLATTKSGTVFHNILQVVNGSDIWQGWVEPSQPAGGDVTKVAATSDGSPDETQFVAVNGSGTVYHDIRFSNGTWQLQGWLPIPTQPPGGEVRAIAATYDGNPGETEFLAVNQNGEVYHNIRLANRNWVGWTPSQPPGDVVAP
jgi:hypothetical protein